VIPEVDINISCPKCGRAYMIVDQEVSDSRAIIDFAPCCECEDEE